MSKQYFSKDINLVVSIDFNVIQELTDMYFYGLISGSVVYSVTSSGTMLLFDNQEALTLIELDPSIIENYVNKIRALSKSFSNRMSWPNESTWSSVNQNNLATFLSNDVRNTTH